MNPTKWIYQNQEKLFKYYLGLEPKESLVVSPFRKDNKPTCGFYYGKTGRLYLHDFGTEEHFDCIEIVKRKFNISYPSALDRIITDADNIDLVDAEQFQAKQKDITWVAGEYHNYFERYKIPPHYLPEYQVFPAKGLYVDQSLYGKATQKNPIFIYLQASGKLRAYRPLHPDSSKKWIGNMDADDVFGLYNLPPKGQILFITSSLKDIMVLKTLGFNAIAFLSEGYGSGKEGSKSREFLTKLLKQLKQRFKHIIFFMDNDTAGLSYSTKLSNIYRLPYITLPKKYPKDISDCVFKHGQRKSRRLIKKQLSHIYNGKQKIIPDEIPF